MLPLVSVVIPVRNDARRLERCLASIRNAGYPLNRMEVLVADCGSTDDSASVGRAAGATVLPLPGLRVAEMRNRAAARSAGEILAFIDADHEICTGWLHSAVNSLHLAGVAAVGHPYDAPTPGTWVQARYDGLRNRQDGVHPVYWLGAGNLAVWRAAFRAVGGFDTTLETCEDVDLCQRLSHHGGTILSDSRMRSVHFGDPATLGALFRGELWRGRDNLRVSIRPPLSARNLASLAVPVAQLMLVGLTVAGVFAGDRRTILLAVTGIAVIVSVQSWRLHRNRAATTAVELAQTVAVAAIYGLARAFALIVRVPHTVRHRQPPP